MSSWNRRKAIFETSYVLNSNKIAFGHYMDNALETLFMNMIYHGSVSYLPHKFSKFDREINLIRQFLELKNDELTQLTKLHEYQTE